MGSLSVGKLEKGSIDSLRGHHIRIVSRGSSSKAEENPGQLVVPGRCDFPGTKSHFETMNEGLGTVGRCSRDHENGLHPSGGAVNDGEKMCVSCRGGQGTYQIHVKMLKVSGGNRNG